MGRIKRKTNPAFAIVADGKTEIWYLQMMKKYELENKQEDKKEHKPENSAEGTGEKKTRRRRRTVKKESPKV